MDFGADKAALPLIGSQLSKNTALVLFLQDIKFNFSNKSTSKSLFSESEKAGFLVNIKAVFLSLKGRRIFIFLFISYTDVI
jgi:hypothetical protein